ncbi:zinc finger BED domain-containing protein RICESLEEPER 2-like [Malus domestica]|uniref:zinc finger BED domain-containing protein RICESLEEPER 2-like n=1 Tax=Malus domestica TaxID=3750 RepID=UPI0039759DB4
MFWVLQIAIEVYPSQAKKVPIWRLKARAKIMNQLILIKIWTKLNQALTITLVRRGKKPRLSGSILRKRCFVGGGVKAVCNHCQTSLASGSTIGTSSLRSHVNTCPVLTTKKKSPGITGDGSVKHGAYSFDEDNARKELAYMIILHEYPLSIVDHLGFKRFCNSLQP